MITRAVILAAGRPPGGNGHEPLRPLVLVDGSPLIQRTLSTLGALGITDVTVVVGYRADELRTALPPSVRVIENPEWRRTSGISLLAAAAEITERCLCILGDRMVHREVLAPIIRLDPDAAECVMLVDTNLEAHPDLAGATKVQLAGGVRPRVVDVGADLVDYQAFDCGHALVSPAILGELARAQHPTVSDGLRAMAHRGLVAAHEIGGRDWRRLGGEGPPRPDARATLAHVEGLLAPKDGQYVLLNPGPVNTTARVKSALVHHDVCHRDSDYSEVLVRVSRKLLRIFRGGPEHSVMLITGSGTAAMECAIASCVPAGKKILCIDNGAFGERMWEIAELHRLQPVRLRYPLGAVASADDVRAALCADPNIAAVAVCHHETSVGVLNPIGAIGAVCRAHDVLLLVDAVSSLGAEDLDVVRDDIDVCWSSGNKCLHGVSGVSFLCVSPRVWPRIEDVAPRVYYLDLKRYRRYFTDLAQTPFTPAVNVYFALDAACDEYLEDGAVRRQTLYATRNRQLRDGLAALGLGFFTDEGAHSILTPRLPDDVGFGELYEELKAAGFIIYDSKPPLKGRYFQIANMGDLSAETLDAFLLAFEDALKRVRRRRYFLRTERLGFRAWSEADAELAQQLWGNPEVTRLIGGPYTAEQVRECLGRELALQRADGLQYWPIFLLATGEHIGCCGLRPHASGAHELGFHLRPEHWGRGYASEAARAVIEYAFGALSLPLLFAGHHPEHDSSRRVVEKLGFRYSHHELYPPTGLQHPSYLLHVEEYGVQALPAL